MKIVEIRGMNDEVVEMIASFRVELRSFKSITSKPDLEKAKEELSEYLAHGYPVYAMVKDDRYVGYVVIRIDNEVVWVESIYVKEEYRRLGVASKLHKKAEEIAESYGNDTLYNYVHPNNHKMIEFLRKHDYTVLNLIEIRKPYKDERLSRIISVGDHQFDY